MPRSPGGLCPRTLRVTLASQGGGAAMKLGGWRKIAGAMWGPPDDPQIYGAMEFDATPLRAFTSKARQAGHRVTATHLAGRAVALALHEVRSEEHTSELQSHHDLVCRLLLE